MGRIGWKKNETYPSARAFCHILYSRLDISQVASWPRLGPSPPSAHRSRRGNVADGPMPPEPSGPRGFGSQTLSFVGHYAGDSVPVPISASIFQRNPLNRFMYLRLHVFQPSIKRHPNPVCSRNTIYVLVLLSVGVSHPMGCPGE